MSCTLITEISFGKHDLENIITAVCFRALWASNFNRKFLLFISLPTHLGNEPSVLGPSYRYISDHFYWFRQMPPPPPPPVNPVGGNVHYNPPQLDLKTKWCYSGSQPTYTEWSTQDPVLHTLVLYLSLGTMDSAELPLCINALQVLVTCFLFFFF